MSAIVTQEYPFSPLEPSNILEALAATGVAAYSWDRVSDGFTWSSNAANALGVDVQLLTCGSMLAEQARGVGWRRRIQWLFDGCPGGTYGCEYQLPDAQGNLHWVEEVLTQVSAEGPTRFFAIMRNIDARKKYDERLAYLAHFDQLTGCLNRSKMRERLAQAIASCVVEGGVAAYFLVGIDNMSGINDAYGYDVADHVIVEVGSRLAECIGKYDCIGRVAGSKFGLVCTGIARDEMEEFSVKLRDVVRETVIQTHAGPAAVTVSVGATSLPDFGRTTHDAMMFAEEALHIAKSRQPDSFMLYVAEEASSERRRRNISVAEQIIAALSDDRLVLAYQPIVRGDNTDIVAFYECLLRVVDDDGRYIAAGEFMPIAEKLGIVRLLDRRVLELAIDTLRKVPNIRLSINLSAQSAQDRAWLQSFIELVEGNTDIAERLIVEVTESTAIDDEQLAAEFVNRARALGCAFAIDDFGAGYTSFRHFKNLKVDMVKIDGGFIRGLCDSPDNQLFVRTLVEIARNFDLMTVAEMVQDDEEAALLHELGVDCFQGFHFGRPDTQPEWLVPTIEHTEAVV